MPAAGRGSSVVFRLVGRAGRAGLVLCVRVVCWLFPRLQQFTYVVIFLCNERKMGMVRYSKLFKQCCHGAVAKTIQIFSKEKYRSTFKKGRKKVHFTVFGETLYYIVCSLPFQQQAAADLSNKMYVIICPPWLQPLVRKLISPLIAPLSYIVLRLESV